MLVHNDHSLLVNDDELYNDCSLIVERLLAMANDV